MNWLELKVPPLVVALVVAALMWAAFRYVPNAGVVPPFRWLLFTIVMLAALVLAGFAIQSFRLAQTTVNPTDPEAAEQLVTSGPFRFSRNPMYVAITLVLVAFAIYLQNTLALALVALFPLYLTRFQIQPEERVLAAKFGDEYEDYRLRVRRWL